MDIAIIKEALGLEETCGDVQILEKIQELRSAAGDSYEPEHPDLTLIKAGQHEQVGQNPDGTYTVTLLDPIPLGKESITEITLRRPKLKDMRKSEELGKGGNTSKMASMIHLLSTPSQAPKLLDELSNDDANVLGFLISFLFEKRPRTGR